MQNYLTARYRQVHNKIKDVRMSNLRAKLPKGIREMKVLSLLDHLSTPPLLDKVTLVSRKIAQFPYGRYWRKSWPVRYWTVGLVVCLPVFYQFQTMTSARTNPEKLDVLRPNVETRRESEGDTTEGNIPRGSD